MKKLIFASLMLLNAPAFGLPGVQYLKDQFCKLNNHFCHTEQLSHFDLVAEAIRDGRVKQVIKLVRADNTTQAELEEYIKIADEHFGLDPKAKLVAKTIGALKLILGFAFFYKAFDHYNDKYKILEDPRNIFNKFCERFTKGEVRGDNTFIHGAPHCITIDIAAIGGFLSAWAGINGALNVIKPKCNHHDHLLIQLYLKTLVKPKN